MTGMRYVGQRVARREDARLVTGHGTYVDDVAVRDALHVAFVRSNVARGRIGHVDIEAAQEVPGVVSVLTASELNGMVREDWLDYEGPPQPGPRREFRVLADGDVRFVGEPVAMVLARTRYAAEDGAELVDVGIDPQPPVVRMEDALADGAPRVHPHRPDNIAGRIDPPEDPELEAIFASAEHVVTETFDQHRYACVPLETRGIVAGWDPFRARMEVRVSTQGPHGVRTQLARVLGLAEHQVRVVMEDVGGGFGRRCSSCPRRSQWPWPPGPWTGRSSGSRTDGRTCSPASTPARTGSR